MSSVKQVQGFTLIELMITITISAILMAIAIPNISDWIRNASIAAAGESFQNGLRSALGEAMKTNTPVEFALASTTVSSANAATTTPAAGGPNWFVMPVSGGAWIAGQNVSDAYPNVVVGGTSSGVIFSGFGKVSDLTGTALTANTVFRLSLSGTTRIVCVYVTPGAGIRSCDPSKPSSDPRACQPALTAAECS